ncbi:MAG: hypothetical protein KAI81_05445, partial [Candidatus Marinimicrobia bacterium]|nr:hypothetical protein [Candidatus Neomarinimicrobiota bacterium]
IPNNPPFIFSGNPVRESLKLITRSDAAEKLGLKANLPTLFIFGGSQGSHAINQSVAKFIPIMFKRWKVQIIWQTGEKDYNHIISTVQSHKSLIIKDYLHHMEEPYSLSDLIISRAGALTLAELAAMEKPAILIPLPTAAANHQYHNAKALEKLGSVRVVEENELSAGHLFNELQNFMDEPEKIEKMRLSMAHIENPDTLNIISDTILKELKLA